MPFPYPHLALAAPPMSAHILTQNAAIVDGCGYYVVRYLEIAVGITLEIGVDADVEIT
jgi:hypothetical protein